MNNIVDKHRMVFYQINPRMFTPQGTLREAKKMLPHIASIGVNVVYLFAICKVDDSKDRRFWSKRQKKSKLNNPKNPYRIADYFEIDEEYGGNEQLREFVVAAHKLGLKVMTDLVYFHCAPNAKIIQDVPDGVIRDENGNVKLGYWNFPCLNFESRALREYLIENMRYFVREFGIDGYRCDVGDKVPLDFWKEAVEEVRKLNPDIIMLNEGRNNEYVASGIFDFNYNWPAPVWADKPLYLYLKESYSSNEENGNRSKGVWFLENHDTVTDNGRADLRFSVATCDLLYVYLFTVNGTPLLYCGEEIADLNEHNMFANREHNRGYGIDWSNALLPHGKRRMALIKKLAKLRVTEDTLALGDFKWLESEEGVLAYAREYSGERICVYMDFEKKSSQIQVKGEILFARNYKDGILKKNGFLIVKEEI